MASSNMGTFVRKRNANESADGVRGFDDLKLNPPAVSNTRATLSRPHQQPGKENTRRRGVPQQLRRASDEQQAFYDTDASDAGKTSTTMSMKRANAGNDPSRQPVLRAAGGSSGPEGSESADGSDEEDEDDSEGAFPDDPLDDEEIPKIHGRLNQKQEGLLAAKGGNDRRRDRDGLPYMKGDSYPPTTSGRPSVSDQDDRAKAQAAQQNQAVPMAQPQQAGRQSSMRAPLGPQSVQVPAAVHQPLPDTQHGFTGPKQDGHIQTPLPGTGSLEHVAKSGLAFGKPGPAKHHLPARPSEPLRQHILPQPPAAQQSLSTNTGQRGSRPDLKPERTDTREVAYQRPILSPDDAAAPQPRQKKESKSRQVRRASPPVQQQVTKTAPEPEPLSNAALEDQNDLSNRFEHEVEHHEEPKEELDYERSELYAMDYRALKKAKFDVNPNATYFGMLDDQPAITLTEQLASVSRLQPADQAHFMSTLDINQWEEAGDWFLGRFGELFSRFRGARQAKRKAASEFEEEIEARHGAVSKKRKLTENALSEMKTSGAQVLQGTPKKVRKTK
ncbi:hypothetical protein LTR36_004535 [Oleoguttula mirabilis]|uniref:Extracellular mutant protein 11 C-terminal domain-containing protein n=1 Tax=Oleoguttula mirabilis TaxID=1507867 RepID=A0AAV9JFY9_9PEZI|nr:hypothetical protein LTR36_004535 [Oleoguttula mirabilis]